MVGFVIHFIKMLSFLTFANEVNKWNTWDLKVIDGLKYKKQHPFDIFDCNNEIARKGVLHFTKLDKVVHYFQ